MNTTLKSRNNHSPFQGVIEANGWRAIWEGSGIWSLYEYSRSSGAFIFYEKVWGKKTATLESLINTLSYDDAY